MKALPVGSQFTDSSGHGMSVPGLASGADRLRRPSPPKQNQTCPAGFGSPAEHVLEFLEIDFAFGNALREHTSELRDLVLQHVTRRGYHFLWDELLAHFFLLLADFLEGLFTAFFFFFAGGGGVGGVRSGAFGSPAINKC